jgi:ribosomal protein L14
VEWTVKQKIGTGWVTATTVGRAAAIRWARRATRERGYYSVAESARTVIIEPTGALHAD